MEPAGPAHPHRRTRSDSSHVRPSGRRRRIDSASAPPLHLDDTRSPRPRLPRRAVDFGIDEHTDPWWNPAAPEFVAAANAVSLMMPYVEPFFARVVRQASDRFDGPLAVTAEQFAAQELSHQREHRRFNAAVRRCSPRARHVERGLRWVFGRLGRRSVESNLAFTAAAECIAYSLARWTSTHLSLFQRGADPAVTTMFIWHLAEEVEHKSVGHDLWTVACGRRWRYVRNAMLAIAVVGLSVTAGTLAQLSSTRRLWNPLTWFRLTGWAVSAGMEVLPTLVVSCLPSHHPADLVDPSWYARWLDDLERTPRPRPPASVVGSDVMRSDPTTDALERGA